MGIEQTRERIRQNFPVPDGMFPLRVPCEFHDEFKRLAARLIWRRRQEWMPKEFWSGSIRKRWYEWFAEQFGEGIEEYAVRMSGEKQRTSGNP